MEALKRGEARTADARHVGLFVSPRLNTVSCFLCPNLSAKTPGCEESRLTHTDFGTKQLKTELLSGECRHKPSCEESSLFNTDSGTTLVCVRISPNSERSVVCSVQILGQYETDREWSIFVRCNLLFQTFFSDLSLFFSLSLSLSLSPPPPPFTRTSFICSLLQTDHKMVVLHANRISSPPG